MVPNLKHCQPKKACLSNCAAFKATIRSTAFRLQLTAVPTCQCIQKHEVQGQVSAQACMQSSCAAADRLAHFAGCRVSSTINKGLSSCKTYSYLRRHASKLLELLGQNANHQLVSFASTGWHIATGVLPHCLAIFGCILCQGLRCRKQLVVPVSAQIASDLV